MKWIFPDPPLWVWDGDVWQRISDGRIFTIKIQERIWISENGEVIPFPDRCMINEA